MNARLLGRRKGFTLVEMLVATALSLFIMIVLTGAFQSGIDLFRKMRATGLNANKLRTATNLLARDLEAPHFGKSSAIGTGGERISDQRLDQPGWVPPDEGFFRIWQEASSESPEGSDVDGLASARATNHGMHFTTRLTGLIPGEFYASKFRQTAEPSLKPNNPATLYNGGSLLEALFNNVSGAPTFYSYPQGPAEVAYDATWAEVAWFLRPNGTSTEGTTPLPLFSLHRRQRTLGTETVRNGGTLSGAISSPDLSTSWANPTGHANNFGGDKLNSPKSIVSPNNRMSATPTDPSGFYPLGRPQALLEAVAGLDGTGTNPDLLDYKGDDIVLTNVLSMEIKVSWSPYRNGARVWPDVNAYPALSNTTDSDYPYTILPEVTLGANDPKGFRFFDTWSDQFLATQPVATSPTEDDPTKPESFLYKHPQGMTTAADYADPSKYLIALQSAWVPNNNTRVPMRIRITGVQIRLRIWDVKTGLTRQVTLVRAM